MRIAVIGAGNIGRTLSEAWRRAGHEVTIGTREPGSVAAALESTDAVLLAVPGGAVEALLAEHGAALAGVPVIDAANSVGGGPLSHLDAFARHAPDALPVRAFNTLGFENFAEPVIDGERADLYWCGPDAAAEVAVRLIGDAGLRPVHVGDADAAPIVDGVAALWFALALRGGHGRRVAFRTLGIAA